MAASTRGQARIGCSGWNYPHWRQIFYPRGLPASRWLKYYAATFDTVEVNATFYRLPTRKATARWVEATPPGFVFAVKASRYLTHVKRLREVADGWSKLIEWIEPVVDAGKLGPVLWQLPERFHRDDERLAAALEALPAGRHAFEFRHASWFCSEVEQILRDHDAALVIGDHPERRFQTHTWTADLDLRPLSPGVGRGRQLHERGGRDLGAAHSRLARRGRCLRVFQRRLGRTRGRRGSPPARARSREGLRVTLIA